MTSHDVVSRMRRIAGTRKVGHAGTLDPMATGVLLIGVERATRLLGLLALTDKAYEATIRLGRATITDDAEGEEITRADASVITDDQIRGGVVPLTGAIEQRPSSVSAIKVDGVRSYARVRAGESVHLPPRAVTVSRFDIGAIRRSVHADGRGLLDVDISVVCGSGTYIRALARDLGTALGVGGHLTALRRTRVGPFDLGVARTLQSLEQEFAILPLGEVLAASYPSLVVDEVTASSVLHGHRVVTSQVYTGPVGIFGPSGEVLSLAEPREGALVPLVVFS